MWLLNLVIALRLYVMLLGFVPVFHYKFGEEVGCNQTREDIELLQCKRYMQDAQTLSIT